MILRFALISHVHTHTHTTHTCIRTHDTHIRAQARAHNRHARAHTRINPHAHIYTQRKEKLTHKKEEEITQANAHEKEKK
jgi:hypothetical protein